jgi:Protein of unknown function (DUF2752)
MMLVSQTGRYSANDGAQRPASRSMVAAVGFVGVGWVFAARALTSTGHAWSGAVVCPVHALTGLDCPGCGSTRAIASLSHGDVIAAFDHNALAPAVVLMAVVVWMVWASRAIRAEAHQRLFGGPMLIGCIAAVIVAFTVLRNTDPGAWLASGLSP